jgi:CheY-like chemotaxis protein
MSRTPIKILVADDDPEDLELIEEHILSVEPVAQLHTVTDGLSAWNYLRTTADAELPALIVLDYNMPGLTGSQVLSSLQNMIRYTSIPKIILSNSSTSRFREECLENGATEYIVKPASMQGFKELATRLVSLARTPYKAGR